MNNIRENLDYYIPNPRCELEYAKDYELLISVMLSAQCTDKKVNEVAKKLYKYTLKELANIDENKLQEIIRPLGSYTRKSAYIKKIANILIYDYNGIVPNDRNALENMPGIGRKCANVVLSELFGIPTIAVDTHVERVSKRLGLAKKNDSILQVEKKLKKIFDEKDYNKVNHQILLFGRYYCTARNPKCESCIMNCKYKKSK